MRLLLFCGSLGLGEYLAALTPSAHPAWPAAALAAALAALFGYGRRLAGWWLAFGVMAGLALYWGAASGRLERVRDRPWLHERVLSPRPRLPRGAAAELRRDLLRRTAIGLDEGDAAAGLGRAILLGDRSGMTKAAKKTFAESGTMHVFAISGLHVMAIAEMLTVAFSLTWMPRRLIGLLAVPLLWGYVAVIGFPPSAVRAGMMAMFSLLAPVCWRRPDGLRSWCLAFLAIHLTNPLIVTDIGNVLSFAVMLAIVLAGERTAGMAKWKRALLVTLAAWAAAVPVAAHVFGRVTPGSMLGNLLLLGIAKLAVVAGAAGVAVSYVSGEIAAHLNNLSALGVRSMVMLAEAVARLPGACLATGAWSHAVCIQWYAAIALLAALPAIRRRRQCW